jgi:hypothetical protein
MTTHVRVRSSSVPSPGRILARTVEPEVFYSGFSPSYKNSVRSLLIVFFSRLPNPSYTKLALTPGPLIPVNWFLAFHVYVVVPPASVMDVRLPLSS